MQENEEATTIVDEAVILESLRLSGERIATLKQELADELLKIRNLYRQYQGVENVSALAGTIIDSNTTAKERRTASGHLVGKRADYNPIKNLNIGVRRSYEWQKRNGYNASDARERVYRSIIDTAIKNGVKSDDGEMITKENGIQMLPKKVIAKIEQCFSEYGHPPKKKKAKKIKAA